MHNHVYLQVLNIVNKDFSHVEINRNKIKYRSNEQRKIQNNSACAYNTNTSWTAKN